MKETKIIETLNSLRNEMTHLWTSFFIVGGGSLTLLFNNPDIWRSIFGFVGVIFAIIFFNAYFIRRNEVMNLLRKIGD